MCGIAGFYSKKRYSDLRENLPEAASFLKHRGPDDAGLYFDKNAGVGLAHRRLSVLDLSSAGHQPMQSEDSAVTITYNGEIYNFIQIQNELRKKGHRFHSASDTEVIIHAYLEWGIRCIQRFIGMFAFAIWDARSKTLIMARDRMGIKPIYYYFYNGTFLFASELKALTAFCSFEKRINFHALDLFLHYQYIPCPHSIYKNTFKLPPGQLLIFDGQYLKQETYWRLPSRRPVESGAEKNEPEYLEHLDGLLTQAVSDRLVSDVPLGTLLSGGIDSSLVAALMKKIHPGDVKTFSIGFSERGYNEAPHAKRIAKFLNTRHTEFYVSPEDVLGVVPEIPMIYDEPFADASALPSFLVSRLTRSQVTVALSGDGGDEQFCGYARYAGTHAAHRLLHPFPLPIRRMIAAALNILPPSVVLRIYHKLMPLFPPALQMENFKDKWQKLILQFSYSDIEEMYRETIRIFSFGQIRQLLNDHRSFLPGQFEAAFDQTADWPDVSRFMFVDQMTYLPDAMLTKVDRASMAVGLEIRVPLLDHRVVEYTASIPESLKCRHGKGKYLLKKLLERYLPANLFERPKMGFAVPIEQWLRREMKPLVDDYLSEQRLKKEGIFNPRFVNRLIEEHLSEKANHQYRLWTLLVWQMWKETWSV